MEARWLLAVAILLAGCADAPEPAAIVAGEPTYGDADVPMGPPLAPLTWQTFAEAPFTIATLQPFALDATVPERTIGVYVNLTLDAGALYGLAVGLGPCAWQRDVALVATGQEVGADCGGVPPGAHTLQLGTSAGAITGTVRLVALLCDPAAGRCPAPLPIP